MSRQYPILNAIADAPDLRDRYYEPSLQPIKPVMPPPKELTILAQGEEGACTGYGLASTINLLYRQQQKSDRVSPAMLYHLARRFDRWPGEDYLGSSCRGAIKGWKNSGVCLEELDINMTGAQGPDFDRYEFDAPMLEDARKRTLGAYYRLRPVISDFHAALNEIGVIFASARVHPGWLAPVRDEDDEMVIPDTNLTQSGGHAFAIVGYNAKGFWIQNSWGETGWGQGGLALWKYEDWAQNLMDAWVVQLALPTPQLFGLRNQTGTSSRADRRATLGSVARQEIENHFIHFDDGSYDQEGRYWSNANHVELIGQSLRRSQQPHLLLYAHGGLNSTKASARRVAAMQHTWMANGIYPIHFMYDTGLMEEIKDVVLGKQERTDKVASGFSDWLDKRIERLTRRPGRALWREMKAGAFAPFIDDEADGSGALETLLHHINQLPVRPKIHVIGHSTGAILHSHLLPRLCQLSDELEIASCSLMAPAATQALFKQNLMPLVNRDKVRELTVYNLSEQLELDDNVALVYRKSLLYLVSRAFEPVQCAKLLGMTRYQSELELESDRVEFVISQGQSAGRSASTSHGGFDNDPNTMNDILQRILGQAPEPPFTKESLDY
ncbi:peptidase C1 [Ferrimonas sp. YFM]|uniref:C1 family peptidase n=1 Tax=Ferrimonas sp. YFM TaxID=3028878 RepID=UPI00257370D8|nr:peptidase C1 [Ferrimonas sp. YFM]BDY04891.1 hypothetical protein F0521_19320 [Ferrimonas sp. YFM]